MQDLVVACSWDGAVGDQYVVIYAATQDPGVFQAMIGSLGAEEIEGPGDQTWWSADLASLFARQGDLVLQVNYTSSVTPSADEVKQVALAVMEVLLRP
jgi:hypothetical protein